MHPISKKLSELRKQIAHSAQKAGREPSSIKLVAASKFQSIENIKAAYEAGQRIFGENYAQELREKAEQLPKDIEWHMIGNVQRRNFKHLLPHCACLESLDSLELAETIEKRSPQPFTAFLQINIGDESSKSGLSHADTLSFVTQLKAFPKIKVLGLMCIPPFSEDPEDSRPYFAQLRELRDEINVTALLPQPMTELSMGMSHDFAVAIEEGATVVRIGSAIFPPRAQGVL